MGLTFGQAPFCKAADGNAMSLEHPILANLGYNICLGLNVPNKTFTRRPKARFSG